MVLEEVFSVWSAPCPVQGNGPIDTHSETWHVFSLRSDPTLYKERRKMIRSSVQLWSVNKRTKAWPWKLKKSPLFRPITKQRLVKADLKDGLWVIVNCLRLRVMVKYVSINPIQSPLLFVTTLTTWQYDCIIYHSLIWYALISAQPSRNVLERGSRVLIEALSWHLSEGTEENHK
jgi:hypothetical protein